MRFTSAALAIAATPLCSVRSHAQDYAGHSVVRVFVADQQQLDTVLGLTDDVWSHGEGLGKLDIRVSPAQRDSLDAAGIEYEILNPDVGLTIQEQFDKLGVQGEPPFGDYADFDGIVAHMNALAASHPDLAEVIDIGTSLEGRTIWAIHVHAPDAPPDQLAVFYNGCQHAREWISPAIPLYMADYFVNNYDVEPSIPALLSRVSLYLVPVFNPDGYAYSWTPNHRLWRKNRRDNGDGSFGVDLNRNWGYEWGHNNGSSGNPSSETYRGTAPFSEPETLAVSDFIAAHPEIVAYIDFHSYSQLTMWPWGYTSQLPPDQTVYNNVGVALRNSILNVFGTTHLIGPIYTTIYPVSGGSVDWTYGDQDRWSYAWELRDAGQFGFLLPAAQILPTCQENLPAGIYLADRFSAPVRFDFFQGMPFNLVPDQENTLTFKVRNGREVVDTTSVELSYRLSSADEFTVVSLEHQGQNTYSAVFPPAACGTAVEFFFTAAGDDGGSNASPLGAPDDVHTVPVKYRLVQLQDNFQADFGWTIQNTPPVSGVWTRVDPNGTQSGGEPAQPEDDNPEGTGTHCFVTGQGLPGGGPAAADVDNGPTRLISPTFDATAGDARISYYRWYFCSNDNDDMKVEISNNDGATWVPLETVKHARVWLKRQFNVADYITPTNQMRVRFVARDQNNNSTTEAAVDDFLVESLTCSTVAGDFNGNGDVDGGDLSSFIQVLLGYATGEDQQLRADMNADAAADGDDVALFVDALFGG